jgi:hypothetical protein
MANLNEQVPIVVIYEKRKGGKKYIEIFKHLRVDDIIDANKRKPPIPHNYEILDIGVGESFIETYTKKYKL